MAHTANLPRVLTIASLIVLSAFAPFVHGAQSNPEKDIKSKDFEVRLAAVEGLRSGEHKKAETLLLKALGDDDWEIRERAAAALGDVGGPPAIKALVKLALEGPAWRVRRAAALSVQKIDMVEGMEAFTKKVGGKWTLRACEAMAMLGCVDERSAGSKLFSKHLRSKELEVSVAAARAMVSVAGEERAEELAGLLSNERISVQAAVLTTAIESPREEDLATFLAYLDRDGLNDVLARRAIAAVRAILDAAGPDRRVELGGVILDSVDPEASAEVVTRRSRLLGVLAAAPLPGELGAAGGDGADGGAGGGGVDGADGADGADARGPVIDQDRAVEILLGIAGSRSENGARRAAARALELAATDNALSGLRRLGEKDKDASVRWIALDGFARSRGVEAAREWLVERLVRDADETLREQAAVLLGVKGLEKAIAPLTNALEDRHWTVAVSAAVSLGKTQEVEAVLPLAKLTRSSDDWRLRGAAAMGLIRTRKTEAIPHLIACVGDDAPEVRKTALHALQAVARVEIEPTVKAWTDWWAENEKRVRLVDPDEEEQLRKKYGYARPASEIYEGIDIVVFVSRGDHIQKVLKRLGIQHRRTEGAKVDEAELHPQAIFVSNCTGEMEAGDVERVNWFVRAGGYLFGSCWALEHTIERVCPDVVERFETTGEVLDSVPCEAWATDSPYLEEVFGEGVVPIYSLVGAYLIQLTNPERAHVLIDSPVCAERFGSGNMAAWFTLGHGVVLDSVNHFEEQGFGNTPHLKKPIERQGYAMDHMGLTYEELRKTSGEKFWKSSMNAAEAIQDLSVFKLVTNFVRLRRLHGGI